MKTNIGRFILAASIFTLVCGSACYRSVNGRTAVSLDQKRIEFDCEIFHVRKDTLEDVEVLSTSDVARLFNATKEQVGDIYVRQFRCEKPFVLQVANSEHAAWSYGGDNSRIESRRRDQIIVTRNTKVIKVDNIKDAFYAAFPLNHSEAGLLNVLRFLDPSALDNEFGANQPKHVSLQLEPGQQRDLFIRERLEPSGKRLVFQDVATGYILFSVLIPPDEFSSLPKVLPYPIIKQLKAEFKGDDLQDVIKRKQDQVARWNSENKELAETYRSLPRMLEVERYRFR